MALRVRAWLLALALVAGAAVAGWAEPVRQELETSACRVVYRRNHGALAALTAQATERILQELHEELGIWFDERVVVHLTADAAEFRERTRGMAPEWSSAVAMRHRPEIVVRAELTGTGIANHIVLTMRHELSHMALFQAEREAGQRLPLWFHEGVATWFSGIAPFQDPQPFLHAAAQDALFAFRDLEEGFPQDRHEARLAYLQSEYFIRHILQEHSAAGLRRWLDDFRRTGDFEGAAHRTLGERLPRLERRFRETYRKRFPWLYLLWEATTLFTVLAFAAIAVYFVRRQRARRIRRAWEREDWMLGRPASEPGEWTVIGGEDDEDDGEEEEDGPGW